MAILTVITQLEPDILECEVKWAVGSITTNKVSGFGCQWGIPTAEVMVRQSRFTKSILDETNEFTLTFPCENSVKTALGFCGQKSGRDCDKISECSLTLVPAKEISTPVVACKGIAFECKVLAKTEMSKSLTDEFILDKWYQNGDLHTLYYAKVMDCYEIN